MLDEELRVATDLALRAGALIRALHATGLAVDRKPGDEPVTQADRDANALIVEGLSAAFPADGILSEELPDDGSRKLRARVWMVDPLDGTKDFIRGREGFATMIGLLVGDRPQLGVVYQPLGDRLYTAVHGAGAFMRDGGGAPVRVHVSGMSDLGQVRLVSSASHHDGDVERARVALGVTDETRIGSVGLKLGLIAQGVRDLYVNPASHSKLWDACAPEALLVEAGGRLSDLYGAPIDYRGPELGNVRGLIASNGLLHDPVVERMSALFPRKS